MNQRLDIHSISIKFCVYEHTQNILLQSFVSMNFQNIDL